MNDLSLPTLTESPSNFIEAPIEDLISVDPLNMSEAQILSFLKETQRHIGSPAKQRATNVRESKKLQGKEVKSKYGAMPDALKDLL